MRQTELKMESDDWVLLPASLKHANGQPRFTLAFPGRFQRDPGADYLVRHEMSGGYELPTRNFLEDFLRPGDVFVDVGAHWGFFTMQAATHPRGGITVVAFEPDAQNAAILLRNVERNGLADRVNVVCAACAAGVDLAPLFVNSTMGHSIAPKGVPGDRLAATRWVPVLSLDSALAKLPTAATGRMIIKIDAEGVEPEVIAGTAGLVAAGRVALVIWECGPAYSVAGPRRQALQQEIARLTAAGFSHVCPTEHDTECMLVPWGAEQLEQGKVCNVFSVAAGAAAANALTLERDLDAALRLHQAGRLEEAASIYEAVLATQPAHAEALHLHGLCQHQLGDHATAAAHLRASLAVRPENPIVNNNYGAVLLAQKRFGEALAAFDEAVARKPDYGEAHNNRGNALMGLRRFDVAVASYDRAQALAFKHPVLFYNRGNACQELGRYREAIDCYGQALAMVPQYVDALHNRGLALESLHRMAEACADYGRALAINPNVKYLTGQWLQAKLMLCDWSGYDEACRRILNGVANGLPVCEPFVLLALPSSLAQQRRCAEIFVRDKFPPAAEPVPAPKCRPGGRIRVGYFSADFHSHPIAYLTAALFECHDRAKFEIVGFSLGPRRDDVWRRRLEAAFDDFVDVSASSDQEVVDLVRARQIDIAVDLMGHTRGARTGIFAQRCAPIQVSYLGYIGTMGAEYIDYLLADAVVVPAQQHRHYAEKIVSLPHCYQANEARKVVADKTLGRAEVGLKDDSFVFCCFNNSYKISPDVFDIWMRLLRQVDGSVLWLLGADDMAVANLRAEARRRGVAADRLVFAGRVDLPEYLARYRLADLFLDTFHYNAGTTASDALWMGLPVLTRIGDTFASRMAASVLRAIGLPELITDSAAAYEAIALALARNPTRLAELRQRLWSNRDSQPLYDTERFTRDLEAAYEQVVERNRADLPPGIT